MSSFDRGLWKAPLWSFNKMLGIVMALAIAYVQLDSTSHDQPVDQHMVVCQKNGDPILSTRSQLIARGIMGKNFLGLEEVRKGYGIVLDSEELAEIPFSEETLRACKDTHVLVALAPLSVNEIRDCAEDQFDDSDWYRRENFADDDWFRPRWILLRKEVFPESRNKTYAEQVALLEEKGLNDEVQVEEASSAFEVAYTVILYWLTHRERLLYFDYVRCDDKDSDGDYVVVGGFDADGLVLKAHGGAYRSISIGLASRIRERL